MADDWVSPDSIEDTGENWHSGTLGLIIDGDSGTFGCCPGLNPGFWTHAAEMTLDTGIQCDKVRIDAGNWYDEESEEYSAIINLDVYWDDAWHDVYDGALSYHSPAQKLIDSGNTHLVTKARANFQYNGDGDEPVDVRFWDFVLNRVAGIVRPLVSGSLAAGKKGLM